MALSEFYLIELPLLLVLRETCFKAMRIQLDNCFNCGNFDFCYFCTKSEFWAITVSEDGHGTLWILLITVLITASIKGKSF